MGWPQMMEYTIPLAPALSKNSTTPMEPFVIWEAIVPKLTVVEAKENE